MKPGIFNLGICDAARPKVPTDTTYTAWAGYYCDVCGNFIPFEDSEQSDGLGRHYCLEIHSKCGAGDNGYYLICPFGG